MTTLPPARILVVDDERLARANLARVLEREGHLLRQAASGEEALALLRDEPADLVITDLAMPGMDGMALLRAVRAEHPQTEIIMVTGYPMIESAVEAMRQGAFHYLAKPACWCAAPWKNAACANRWNRCARNWKPKATCPPWWAILRPCAACVRPCNAWPPRMWPCCCRAKQAPAKNWPRAPCTLKPAGPTTLPGR